MYILSHKTTEKRLNCRNGNTSSSYSTLLLGRSSEHTQSSSQFDKMYSTSDA